MVFYHRIFRYRSNLSLIPSPYNRHTRKGRFLPFSRFSFSIICIVFTLTLTMRFYSPPLLCGVIIYFLRISTSLLSFFLSFIQIGREREREREIKPLSFNVLSFSIHMINLDRETKEREKKERNRSSSFPSLPFLFRVCQRFIIFHPYPNRETKEREREREIDYFLFFSLSSISLPPTFYHFFYPRDASRSGNEREREREREKNRVVSFSFPSLPLLFRVCQRFIIFHPRDASRSETRERGREIGPLCRSSVGAFLAFGEYRRFLSPFFQGLQHGDSDRSFERRVRDRIWSFGHLSTSAGGTGIGEHHRFS